MGFGVGQKVADFISLFIMGILSLGLLAYVGYGEARQNYPRIELDKVIAQGRPFQFALEKYLSAGLPLRQFVGFESLAAPVVRSDSAIDMMTVVDRVGAVVFRYALAGQAAADEIVHDPSITVATARKGPVFTEIILPLRSRFGFGGQVILHVPNSHIDQKISRMAKPLPWVVLAFSIGLGLVGALVGAMPAERRAIWDKLAFVVAFTGVSAAVVYGLATLYSDGVQSRAVNLASALAERLRIIYDFGLTLEDVDSVEQTLASYRGLNPDLGNLALIVDGLVVFHTDPAAVGRALVPDREAFGVTQLIGDQIGVKAMIYASIPYSVVLLAIARSAKTFVVLLLASAFVAGVFYQLGGALRKMRQSTRLRQTDGQSAIEAIKPVLFMGFFVENLAVSFLPQWIQASAVASGWPAAAAAAVFMAYFLAFAVVLAPAGHYAERVGPKTLILGGAVLVASAAAILAASESFLVILASRVIAGLGQGVLFIGGQSFILANAGVDRRTQSAGVIVYSFNAGMLSGMAIGGLLVGYLSPVGVFWLGGGIIACAALYTWLLVAPPPQVTGLRDSALMESRRAGFAVFRERGFLWATVLVGIPTKMALTGVIIFAMPLVLSQLELERQNIGQVIMFYAVGVLTASHFISRFADRFGRLREILFVGLCLSGIGLSVIGLVGLPQILDLSDEPLAQITLLLVGVLIVGFGHGFVNAPIISYVGATEAARRLGEAPVTAFYRLIERVGHIGGPLIVGQLYFFFDRSPALLTGLGLMMLLFAALFLVAPSVAGQEPRDER